MSKNKKESGIKTSMKRQNSKVTSNSLQRQNSRLKGDNKSSDRDNIDIVEDEGKRLARSIRKLRGSVHTIQALALLSKFS